MTRPTAVTLRLPVGWIELDPRGQDLVGELHRAIDVPVGADDAAVALLAPLALELARTSAQADVVLVGFFARAIDIAGSDEPYVVTANVVLAVSPPVGGLDHVRSSRDGEYRPVDLPAGSGVVMSGETTISDAEWDGEVPARLRRYLIPVPGTDRMAALNFLTPNLDLADQFDEVFDAIAATLEFGWDDDPAPDAPATQP